MRVVVSHPDADHPNAEPFAYRMGRITDHTDFLTGDTTSADKVADKLMEMAKEEYPGHQVTLERFRDNEDGTGEWVDTQARAQPVDTTESVLQAVPDERV